MTCIDCTEHIKESERKASRLCAGCALPMHEECAMFGPQGSDFCEPCFYRDAQNHMEEMKRIGGIEA